MNALMFVYYPKNQNALVNFENDSPFGTIFLGNILLLGWGKMERMRLFGGLYKELFFQNILVQISNPPLYISLSNLPFLLRVSFLQFPV